MRIEGLQSIIEAQAIDGKLCVRKTATQAGQKDVEEQIHLLQSIPPSLRPHYPDLIDFNLTTSPFYYTMPFYDYPTIRYLLLHTQSDSQFICDRLEKVLDFLFNVQHKWREEDCPAGYIERIYWKRARTRLLSLATQDQAFKEIISCDYVFIGGERFISPLKLVDEFSSDDRLNTIITPTRICSTHGQMEFAHILLDTSPELNDKFILLDPKGMEHLLDSAYDVGKLLQCSYGYLDWIDEALFRIPNIHVDQNQVTIDKIDFNSPDRLQECSKINHFIESKVLDYGVSSQQESFYMRCLVAASAHLCATVPFCYGNGNLQKAVACYVAATQALNRLRNQYAAW